MGQAVRTGKKPSCFFLLSHLESLGNFLSPPISRLASKLKMGGSLSFGRLKKISLFLNFWWAQREKKLWPCLWKDFNGFLSKPGFSTIALGLRNYRGASNRVDSLTTVLASGQTRGSLYGTFHLTCAWFPCQEAFLFLAYHEFGFSSCDLSFTDW